MYRVEVLPNASKSNATPGWTYVPDKGFDPAKAAIAPTTGRKRGIRDPARTDVSSRQANAIVRHLAELDRENHRDVAIAIPARKDSQPRESATRESRNRLLRCHAGAQHQLPQRQNQIRVQRKTPPRPKTYPIRPTYRPPTPNLNLTYKKNKNLIQTPSSNPSTITIPY
ncbi:hypothetical protein AN2095.2 [Aspergillus nidulans FGSC A4]|nr:hypothetical protein AN2095.2 [Aspergillus nidulans FGSC A4]|eukprot:XP_659699.1 hypothetical protein AN2095.2 [Aspergillus nidulans FGSC A4]